MNLISDPFDILENYLLKEVKVKMRGGETFEGRLLIFDEGQNILIEELKNIGEDKLNSNSNNNNNYKYIRGGNILYICE